MKKFRWYSLPVLPTLLIVAVAGILLIAAFTRDLGPVLTGFSYLLSAYALVVGISGLIRFIPWLSRAVPNTRLMHRLHRNAKAARYLDDPLFRTQINLYFGTAVNALYIFIKFFSGVALRSGWLIAFALYYVVLTSLRASLVNFVRQHELKRDLRAEYRRYRSVGILLLGLNVVLSGIISRMIAYNDAYDYPGILIYAMAAYTFYAVILSIVALVRFRRHGSPILSAIKVVNLTTALVALLSLEATMLQRFGEPEDGVFRGKMIGITGLAASLILFGMSFYMIVHASKKLKQMGENKNE